MRPQTLRIITGKLKNRKIKAPTGKQTRPSLEKTRGIIFDTLGSRLDFYHYQAVDLFSGSGALGIEAYSRGAEPIYFCEPGSAYKTLAQNTQSLLPAESFFLFHSDGLAWLRGKTFSGRPWIFLLDPPYQQGLDQQTLDLISQHNEQLAHAWVVLESSQQDAPKSAPNLALQSSKRIGKSRLDFFKVLQ